MLLVLLMLSMLILVRDLDGLLLIDRNKGLNLRLPRLKRGPLLEYQNERIQPFVFHIDRQAHLPTDRAIGLC